MRREGIIEHRCEAKSEHNGNKRDQNLHSDADAPTNPLKRRLLRLFAHKSKPKALLLRKMPRLQLHEARLFREEFRCPVRDIPIGARLIQDMRHGETVGVYRCFKPKLFRRLIVVAEDAAPNAFRHCRPRIRRVCSIRLYG